MRIRVECLRCGAHKDHAVYRGPCFVCGYHGFRPVPPNAADLRELEAQRALSAPRLVEGEPAA